MERQYTEQDVRDAYFARACCLEAQAEGTTPGIIATHDIALYPDGEHLDEPATQAEKDKALARLHNGLFILMGAKLEMTSEHQVTETITLVSPDAPTILVQAGYIATSPAYLQVMLRKRPSKYDSTK